MCVCRFVFWRVGESKSSCRCQLFRRTEISIPHINYCSREPLTVNKIIIQSQKRTEIFEIGVLYIIGKMSRTVYLLRAFLSVGSAYVPSYHPTPGRTLTRAVVSMVSPSIIELILDDSLPKSTRYFISSVQFKYLVLILYVNTILVH